MILAIILFVSILSIIGCIKVKKSVIRIILGIVAACGMILFLMAGTITYVSKYKINFVDSSVSPDGKYELVFQQIGDPEWPFGRTHANLLLKNDSHTIAEHSFYVSNDGANVLPNSWQVTWEKTCAVVIIYGDEQNDVQYNLCFDGKVESERLDTKYGESQ